MGKAFNYVRGDISRRFWSKVNVAGKDECWEWLASLDSRGYGNFGVPKDDGSRRYLMQRAHRIAWELTNGPLIKSQHLCHTCDNRKCVNPSHLFVGDAKLNMQDCISKGRRGDRKGQANPKAKLTPDQILDIRSSGLPLSAIARAHGISKSTAHSVRSGATWGHV
jgi:hypothetical protein